MNNCCRRLLAAVGCVLMLLTGCSNSESLDIRMDIGGPVDSLDPQFVMDSVSQTIVSNTFTGLVRRDEQGHVQPAGASSWQISSDGLLYSFELREDMCWSNGDPVVAADYRFALRRLFNSQVPSPFAPEYLNIRNAQEVLSGAMPASLLGVSAKGDYTLEITLSQPSPVFLERLAEPAAMPCQEKFFTSTRARYGLGMDYTIFNGPFYIYSWNNEKSLWLAPNPHYPAAEQPACPRVLLYTTRLTEEDAGPDSQLKLFLEGKSDVCPVTHQQLSQVTDKGVTSFQLENRVWQLTLNTRHSALQNEKLRQGLLLALDDSGYRQRVPEMYGMADSLLPEIAQMEDLLLPDLPPYNRQWAMDSWNDGLAELEQEKVPALTLLLPETAQLETLGAYMQKLWKDALGVYINLELLSEDDFEKRLRGGSYTLALRPVEAGGQEPVDVLGRFMSVSADNVADFANLEYDLLLEEAARAVTPKEAARLYSKAEQMLVDAGVALPVLTQSSYYLYSKGTRGVTLQGGRIIFQSAVRVG